MKRIKLIIICAMLVSIDCSAQFLDTVAVMHYNLLNYRNHFNECDTATNSPQKKDNALFNVVKHYKPNILTFNEIGKSQKNIDSLLLNALHAGTGLNYQAAPISGFGYLINALFYDQNQFVYHRLDSITHDLSNQRMVRTVDVHQLYFLNPGDLSRGDTSFLVVYVAHFKAGSSLDDQDEREAMAKAIMAYHSAAHSQKNYVLSGDFNVRSSSEKAYQELSQNSNSNIRFHDPINSDGAWNSNSTFAQIHTQSTRSASTNNGCFSGGGLDDRFDFILCGPEIINGTLDMSYVSGSYQALGNDGIHFNKDILSPTNNSAPTEIINSMYELSDHLPVYMEIEVNSSFSRAHVSKLGEFTDLYFNRKSLYVRSEINEVVQITIIDPLGRIISQYKLDEIPSKGKIDLSDLQSGTYIAILQDGSNTKTCRFILTQ
ncbi:MAG: T9SS type A sorting domain-containing protein [Bacteroidia bacterium]